MPPVQQPEYLKFLPPEAIHAVGRLEYLARQPMEGTLSGRHRSPHKGFSAEFAEHRQYVWGDELRLLDWRVYARTDRYYVKEFIEETNLRATILLDASGSMAYAGNQAHSMDGRPLSKFDYARRLAAMMTYLLIHQQDATAMVSFDKSIRKYLPCRAQPKQLRRILEHITELEAGGETSIASIFHEVAERIPKRGLVVIFSDLFDDPEAIINALHHFRFYHHEILVFHVMAEEELTFPLSGFSNFNDLEGVIDPLPIDPASLRAQYLEEIDQFLNAIESGCGRMGAEYIPVSTKTNVHEVLAQYIQRRQRHN